MKLQVAICLIGIYLVAVASAGNTQKSKERRPVKSVETKTSIDLENIHDNDSDLVKKSWKKVFSSKYDDTEEVEGASRYYDDPNTQSYPQPQQKPSSQPQPQPQSQSQSQPQPPGPSQPLPPTASNPNYGNLQCICTPVNSGYPYMPQYPPQYPNVPMFPFPHGPFPRFV